MSPSLPQDMGGLSHLVEAATALTELVVRAPVAASKLPKTKRIKSPKPTAPVIISDDDYAVDAQPHKKKEIFPQKLMEILADTSLSDVISWLPHGRSFVIIRPDLFCEQVLPKYLPPVDTRGSTKYPSFTRKLNRWGFRQATRGADTGAFHHPCFRRDQPELCLQMVCQKSRDRQAPAPQNQKRSLPPKKRCFVGLPPSSFQRKDNVEAIPLSPQTQFAPALMRPISVSTDERSIGNSSIASQGSSNDSFKPSFEAGTHPKFVVTSHPQLCSNETAKTMSKAPSKPPSSPPVAAPPRNSERASPGALPFVSNDSKFVASTLKQRDEQEILRAAQAMLYESFLQALQLSQRHHS